MFISINPVPKPRLTQRDKWAGRPNVETYYAFCNELQAKYPDELPDRVSLKFYLPMPKYWSGVRKDRHRGIPHQQRPDIDNLCKAVLDALCKDDSYIYELRATKFWSDEGGIDIEAIV